jgi:excisionase family DNA binding protein
MNESKSEISLQEAADHLGVHYMTTYRYVRLGLLPAHKEGGTWRVATADLEAFRQEPDSSVGKRGDAPWDERLEARMIAGDVAGAWSVVEAALAAGAEPKDIYVNVLAPALASIGEKWTTGEVDVAEEHLASAVASRIIGRMGPRFARRGRPKGTIITAMPPGERHGFGVSMLSDVFRGAGYAVLDLGPDTPIPSLLAAVDRLDGELSAVCISVAFDELIDVAGEMVSAIKQQVGSDVPVLLGGRGVGSAEVAASLGADGFTHDPDEAIEFIGTFPEDVHTA